MEDRPSIIGRVRSATTLLALSPLTLSLNPLRGVRKVTSRFRRLAAVTRGQASRPDIVDDRSSSVHHHHCMRSVKSVSTFYHFPLENTPGNSRECPGKFPPNRGEVSPESRGDFPGIAGKFPGNRGEISRESDAFARRSNRSHGSPELRKKNIYRVGTFVV